jgi:hypothetical protein
MKTHQKLVYDRCARAGPREKFGMMMPTAWEMGSQEATISQRLLVDELTMEKRKKVALGSQEVVVVYS